MPNMGENLRYQNRQYKWIILSYKLGPGSPYQGLYSGAFRDMYHQCASLLGAMPLYLH